MATLIQSRPRFVRVLRSTLPISEITCYVYLLGGRRLQTKPKLKCQDVTIPVRSKELMSYRRNFYMHAYDNTNNSIATVNKVHCKERDTDTLTPTRPDEKKDDEKEKERLWTPSHSVG